MGLLGDELMGLLDNELHASVCNFVCTRSPGLPVPQKSLVDIRQQGRLMYCRRSRGELMGNQIDLLQGTLDLLILKTLALGPMHGWGIGQRIQQVSQEVLQVGQGSLYPALARLEQRGWISAEWSTSDNNRRARFYSLTRAGAKQLERELGEWERLSAAIALVLQQS
jgi:PadR family transcriptional regulator, regulatory protein PadR